jgi:sugar phosphate isomerase/epimerase
MTTLIGNIVAPTEIEFIKPPSVKRSMNTRRGITRREALGALGVLAFGSHALFAAEPATKMARIALQLYTMRDLAKKDLDATLKQCADMGWKYVQWSGMPALKADQIRAALDKAGLICVAAHVSIEDFEKNFDEQVAFWKTVGARDIAPGEMMKDCRDNLDNWLKGAKRLEDLAVKLKSAGIRLSFHNHTGEFAKFTGDDRLKEDLVLETAKNVNMELDIAWAAAAKADPAAYLRKYKGRCPVVHAKDVLIQGNRNTLTALGKGSVKWDDVFAAGKEAGVEWYIYEQDNGQGTPIEFARASYEWLSKQAL